MADERIINLAKDFAACQKLLECIGDENRFHLMTEMMQMGKCMGVRVGEITEKSHLSRPAVSHHLKIMKDAGIVKVRREGTKNYYYFDSEQQEMKRLIKTLQTAVDIAASLPDRSEEK